jgi:hypothetical protein
MPELVSSNIEMLTPAQQKMIQDLAKSGLVPEDINAREAGPLEFAAINVSGGHQGYVIPYYDIDGKPKSFYRIRLFNGPSKYRQIKNSGNHIYYPPGFARLVQGQRSQGTLRYVIICEGEKKAAACVKVGIPAVALGGVDSWKTRNIIVPEGAEFNKTADGKSIAIKIPQGAEDDVIEEDTPVLAKGLQELLDLALRDSLHLIIAFDRDTLEGSGVKPEVQRAAAHLGFGLRFQGIPFAQIHQLLLPSLPAARRSGGQRDFDKVGLDDYLVATDDGGTSLRSLIDATLSAPFSFPRHPNIQQMVVRKLQKGSLTRNEVKTIALAILSELDASGRRLRSEDEKQSYYFDKAAGSLIPVNMNMNNRGLIHETAFGQLLYRRFGLSAADGRLLTWLDAQFQSEQPIESVQPHRVIARPRTMEDAVRYQISDSQYVKVTADEDEPVQILDNGSEGYLFEAGQVKNIDAEDLREALKACRPSSDGIMPCWWDDVLKTVRLRDPEKTRLLAAVLFYISPWLYRWRGTQLPIELILGESGSGKSSLCEHRLNILTGNPNLRNAPADLRDWHASISNTGGLHVTDNVQLLDKNLRQRLSDEICRLVTEPDPHIEARKLYSNNELVRVPVSCSFAITAIQQPFMQADLLARAIVIELDKSVAADENAQVTYDASWVPHQMQSRGGRTMWVAHHLMALHQFFKLVKKEWNPKYMASNRLINVEQALILMGKVFGMDLNWAPKYLTSKTSYATADADWALEGLTDFARMVIARGDVEKRWSAMEITAWALGSEDYAECVQLANPRKLGRYIDMNKVLVASIAGIREAGKIGNRRVYAVRPTVVNKMPSPHN